MEWRACDEIVAGLFSSSDLLFFEEQRQLLKQYVRRFVRETSDDGPGTETDR